MNKIQPTLPQVEVFDGHLLHDLQLELSLKPFYDLTPETREAVCREIFSQWQALSRYAKQISILLWVAEGSEILEYDGDMNTEFEWACHHGSPNRHRWDTPGSVPSDHPDHNAIGIDIGNRDPDQKGIHSRSYLYRPDPAKFTYGWLRDLVSDLKRIGGEMTGLPILVGAAFDIGPEFSKSRFKYEWHREILGDGPVFKEQFISCEAVLKGDERRYAAYPKGIPDGLTFGEFLGKQTRQYFDDCGQDFIWLSNGFGFALEPWAMVGKLFDGECFHADKAAGTVERIMDFWINLRRELGPVVQIRTRGTNQATGIDLGSDASPLERIFDEIPGVEAPVNSPWAALDGDFGLELSGWMSHIAKHPGETFRFRFYLHDPWWLNSPWFDRYDRSPHDLYLPLSVSRLNTDGSVEIPRDLAILTIDDSHGRMPPAGPNEVTSFFLRAREMAPDALGPLVWMYPLNEYTKLAIEEGLPEVPFNGDAWVGTLINAGVPLSSVADADILGDAVIVNPESVKGRIFFVPVPRPGSDYERKVRSLMQTGVDVIFFGPIFEGSFLWDELGVVAGEGLEGDFAFAGDRFGLAPKQRHLSILSAGDWKEKAAPLKAVDILMELEAEQNGERRLAFRVIQGKEGNRIGWVRASMSTDEYDLENPKPIYGPVLHAMKNPEFVACGDLGRVALRAYGWELKPFATPDMEYGPYLVAHRHQNSLVLSGYHRNMTSRQLIRTPLGAPILRRRQCLVEDGCTVLTGEQAWQSEVRAFVDGMESGEVYCREIVPAMHGVRRRILIGGFLNATIRILPHPDFLETLRLLHQPQFPYFQGRFAETKVENYLGYQVVTVENASGELLIEW